MIRRLFSPPVYGHEGQNFRAKLINAFAWSAIGLLLIAMLPHLFGAAKNYSVAIYAGLIIAMLFALYLLHRGNVDASGMAIIVLGWLGVSIQAFTADGVKDAIVIAFLALGFLASILVNWRFGVVAILTSVGMIWTLALLQVNNYFVPSTQDPIAYARDLSLVFVAVSVLIYFSTKIMWDAIERATISEKNLLVSNQQLMEFNESFENLVEKRTAELTVANVQNERRARQFEAIAQVARAITPIQEEELLLSRLAEVISEFLSYYHVGIFLLDGEQAVLRASNSEAGRKMLARGHRLDIGHKGIVGHVATLGKPRIALDLELNENVTDSPGLSETRSELALPLEAGDQLIGVLDLQSTEMNAFQPEDAETLSLLADQVALAIQNARTHEATRRLLDEAQRTSASYLKETWRLLQSQEKKVGYFVSENTVKPLENFVSTPQIHNVVSQGEVFMEEGTTGILALPIRLRDEVVGVMDIHVPSGHDWDPDEVDIAKAVADRLSLALETATLLESTQRRAEIERVTADISAKVSASINLRNVLQTAVEELGSVLPGSDIVIQLASDLPSPSNK